MDDRVTRLETHMDYLRADIADIKTALKENAQSMAGLTQNLSSLTATVQSLPTRNDLWAWKLQWVAILLVGFATIVGGIIGGLGWIKAH
jgi:septal ring factor EnvC (AmiA/AmiB activator)